MSKDLSRWATWREIHAQPRIWRDWGAALDVAGLRDWIAAQSFDEIWFSGAGTSAYVGDILAAAIPGTRSVPTTDIVANPQHLLAAAKPLLVSFGRSGNSSETVGTLDAFDALSPHTPRLNITCNREGALAQRTASGASRAIVLPDATHDTGFAMTSSFSTMYLTALALFCGDAPSEIPTRFAALGDDLSQVLSQLKDQKAPARAVYIGSGPLAFAAREAALKVTELSAGRIPALWDSTLGFRHGPKSFVTEDTSITLFTSDDAPARDYDRDLAAELRQQFPASRMEVIGPSGDIDVAMPFGSAWGAPICVATAQVRGVQWSEAFGLNVDDPFAGQNTLSRVVSGVKLYPVQSPDLT